MRRARLHEFVIELITSTWTGEDADVAEAVTSDEDAFGALAHQLNEAGDGEPEGIAAAWQTVVDSLSDDDLDFLAERADNPAAFLFGRV